MLLRMGTFVGGVIVEPSRSLLGSGEVATAWGLLLHSLGRRVYFFFPLFSSLSFFFLPLLLPPWGIFGFAGSSIFPFLLLVLSTLFMLLGSLLRGVIFF